MALTDCPKCWMPEEHCSCSSASNLSIPDKLNESDLKIEPYPVVSPGGQHVSVVRTGIKVTHVPTGLIAISDCERSQMKNKNVAVQMIEYGLAVINYGT